VADHPTHPSDQSPCIIEACPGCHKPMWVSEKKRKHKAQHPKAEIACFRCLIRAAINQGIDCELADIGDVQ